MQVNENLIISPVEYNVNNMNINPLKITNKDYTLMEYMEGSKAISTFTFTFIPEEMTGEFVHTVSVIPNADIKLKLGESEYVLCKKNVITKLKVNYLKPDLNKQRLYGLYSATNIPEGFKLIVGNETLTLIDKPTDVWTPSDENIDIPTFKLTWGGVQRSHKYLTFQTSVKEVGYAS